jgi:RNA polymerase-binding transcription factor DksA
MSTPDEKTRYSREELQEFKDLILEKLAAARKEYKTYHENIRNTAEMTSDAYNATEYGSEIADKQQSEMLMARMVKFIDALERALIRIENGTYGKCKVTGKLIPKERLRLVPHTETSIEAKTGHA